MHTLSAAKAIFLRPALACVLFFVVGAAQAQPAPTGLLNDTGQTQCANASHELVACDSATAVVRPPVGYLPKCREQMICPVL